MNERVRSVALDTLVIQDPHGDWSCRCTGPQWMRGVESCMARADGPVRGLVAHPSRRRFAVLIAAKNALWLRLTPYCQRSGVFLLSQSGLPERLDWLDPRSARRHDT